jgi:NAD/NADP transhydrogenase alpha subunit
MSRIAGRLAFLDALEHYSGDKPRLTVIGAGSAGISSAFEAIKQGVPVQVFGRKESQRAKLEAAGITYYVLPEVEEKQIDFIKPYLAEETIVITAARTPGKKAPLLIDETSLCFLPSNAVVVDLAISNGGNVAGNKHDQVIHLDTGVMDSFCFNLTCLLAPDKLKHLIKNRNLSSCRRKHSLKN